MRPTVVYSVSTNPVGGVYLCRRMRFTLIDRWPHGVKGTTEMLVPQSSLECRSPWIGGQMDREEKENQQSSSRHVRIWALNTRR